MKLWTKPFLKAIFLTLLMIPAAAFAQESKNLGAELHSGVERVLTLRNSGTYSSFAEAQLAPAIAGELELMRERVRACRQASGDEFCVAMIDTQIRAYNRDFSDHGLQGTEVANLVIRLLHDMRLIAYGVER